MEVCTDVKNGFYHDGTRNVIRDLENIKNNFLMLGYHLLEIYEYGWYRALYHSYEDSEKNFYLYCKEQFNLSKSTVSRYMNIVGRFCIENSYELQEQYKGYSSSQLIEMLPLADDDLDYCKPTMTVKQIRELKTYDTKRDAPEQANIIEGQYKIVNDVKEELETVATSQQSNEQESCVSRKILLERIDAEKRRCLNDDSMQQDYASGYLTALNQIKNYYI